MVKAKNNIARRVIAMIMAAVMLISMSFALVSCGKKTKITVWVYSDEYKTEMENFLNTSKLKTTFDANIRVVNSSDFEEELSNAIEKKQDIPDVFMLSPDNISKYVNSEITADVTSLGLNVNTDDYYAYTLQAATDGGGKVKAIGWQADPGLFMYRRSMAKVYLGTDTPDEVQAMVSTWDGFYDTAKQIYAESGGKTRILAGQEDLMRPYMAGNDSPWIQNNKLVISDTVSSYLDYIGKMSEEHLIYTAEQWSEAWVKGISDSQSVFGYFSSGICMQYAMKKACGGKAKGEGSYGDWAVIPGPSGYCWGGSWLAAYSGSKQKKAAGEFISIFTACTDDETRMDESVKYFRTSGEFSASKAVVSQIRFDPQFEDTFIGGQNYYHQLSIVADDVEMSNLTVYDNRINVMFNTYMNEYVAGLKSKEQALADFKTSVNVAFPEINTD